MSKESSLGDHAHLPSHIQLFVIITRQFALVGMCGEMKLNVCL